MHEPIPPSSPRPSSGQRPGEVQAASGSVRGPRGLDGDALAGRQLEPVGGALAGLLHGAAADCQAPRVRTGVIVIKYIVEKSKKLYPE